MPATTITRESIVDDTGSPGTPAEDGTVFDSDFFNDHIWDPIDAILANNVTWGGLVGSEGFGLHSFTAAGTGFQQFRARNTSAGTTNGASVEVGNDASANLGRFRAQSSTYTTASHLIANGVAIEAIGAGGLALAANNAAGDISFWAGGLNKYAMLDDGGHWDFASGGGASTNANFWMQFQGAHAGASGTTIGLYAHQTITGASGGNVDHVAIVPTGTTTSGSVSAVASVEIREPVITVSSGSITTASTLWILNAPTEATNNYSLLVDAGTARFDGSVVPGSDGVALGAASLGWSAYLEDGALADLALRFAADEDNGLYRLAANQWSLVVAGKQALQMSVASGGVFCKALLSANGTGAVLGNYFVGGNNTDGSGAAGGFVYQDASSGSHYTWVDATGDLRINGAGPTEDGSTSDTAGTVVGDQSSLRAAKDIVSEFTDYQGALRTMLETPLWEFAYRSGRYHGEHFIGITTDDSPIFGKDAGRSFNELTAFGYTVAAFKGLWAELEDLRAANVALRARIEQLEAAA